MIEELQARLSSSSSSSPPAGNMKAPGPFELQLGTLLGEGQRLLATNAADEQEHDEQRNLLEALQIFARRREDLRRADEQLVSLMESCSRRLAAAWPGAPPVSTPSEQNQLAAHACAPIDLTCAARGQLAAVAPATKRPNWSPAGVNFKKMRLLSAANFADAQTDCTQETSQAHKSDHQDLEQRPQPLDVLATAAAAQTEQRSESQCAFDELHDDQRPRLKKFCSIGTLEISREQFSRQQQLFGLTLAQLTSFKLVGQPAKTMAFDLAASFSRTSERTATLSDYQLGPEAATHANFLWCQQQQQQQQKYFQQVAFGGGQAQAQSDIYGAASRRSTSSSLCELPEDARTSPPCAASSVTCRQQFRFKQLPGAAGGRLMTFGQSAAVGRRLLGGCAAQHGDAIACNQLVPVLRKMAFKCHVCAGLFEDRHRLQQHLSIHLELKASWFEEKTIEETMAHYELRRGDYLCAMCQLRSETTAEFDRHMQLHAEKPHLCKLCEREGKPVAFRYFRQFLTHLRSHCFLFTCKFTPDCRQTANRKDYLKLHILKHHLNNKLPAQHTSCYN